MSMTKLMLNNQRGIGLIELMISITLGLFLIAGAIGVLVSSKTTHRTNNALSWVQDNARFAMMTINRDLRTAGYFGCSSESTMSSLNPGGSTDWYIDFTRAVRGWDGDDTAGYPDTEFPSAYNSAAAAGFPASDIVTIKFGDSTDVRVDTNVPTNNANVRVHGSHPFQNGDILAISDCQQTSVFQVNGNANSQVIVHNTGNSASPGNCTRELGGTDCSNAVSYQFTEQNGAFIIQMKAHAYFVNESNDGTPALFRRELYSNSGDADVQDIEIVQGVESMQVLYGFDANGDGAANRYVNASDLTFGTPPDDWASVVTVRVHMLFRSFAEVATEPQEFRFVGENYTPNDRYLRQEFVSTVELRNKR